MTKPPSEASEFWNCATFWKRKLAAFLHDSPSKCLDIPSHHEIAFEALKRAGFTDETDRVAFAKGADHMAAAADRLPFPDSCASGLRCAFDGRNARFRHPLSGEHTLEFNPIESSALGAEVEQKQQPGDYDFSEFGTSWESWRARHFAHWRLWRRNMVSADFRFDFLPADTRIPDHSIWTHTATVSAIQGCIAAMKDGKPSRPAFLKLQIGGVQEFIQAARSTRDLWSASYLMSWLMAAALKELASRLGPDAILYPNLFGQPVFDLHWRCELWRRLQHQRASESCWDGFGYHSDQLTVPNLPNVALALVPDAYAAELAQAAVEAAQAELLRIAEAVWVFCDHGDNNSPCADEPGLTREQRRARFDDQVGRFLSISWSVQVWPDSLDAALAAAERHPDGMPVQDALTEIQRVIKLATRGLPEDHRDSRYYEGQGTTLSLNNIGVVYPAILAEANEKLAGVRETRPFDGLPASDGLREKDALTGQVEAVAGGPTWCKRWAASRSEHKNLFKHADWLGAVNLIKRVWHVAYLCTAHKDVFSPRDFAAPSVPAVARGDERATWAGREDEPELRDDTRYFAVLALDGDEMGKWVSGEKLGKLREHLADYTVGDERRGSLPYFEERSASKAVHDFLEGKRSVTPSFNLQFSQALSNFAVHCVRRIVESHNGYLVLAGGDDVLALLPAHAAVNCARDLRSAFRGTEPVPTCLGLNGNGFVVVREENQARAKAEGLLDQNGRPVPLIVPGPKTDCSVGIAIAHVGSPLQDAVRAAHKAEKRAKNKLERSAIAVTVMKGSGEIVEWGAKWDAVSLDLFKVVLDGISEGHLSGKFPHAVVRLLTGYISTTTPLLREHLKRAKGLPPAIASFNTDFAEALPEIITREVDHVLERQRGPQGDAREAQETRTKIRDLSGNLASTSHVLKARGDAERTTRLLQHFVDLFQTAAFAERVETPNQSSSQHS